MVYNIFKERRMKMKKNIDLHMHTINSDGTSDINELIKLFNENEMDIVAITDHDNVNIYEQIKDNHTKKPLTIITATELGCSYEGVIRDVLGYGVDTKVIKEFVSNRYSKENKIKQQIRLLEEYKRVFKRAGLKFDDDVSVCKGSKSEAFINLHASLMKYPENIKKYPFIAKITLFFWNYCSDVNSKFFVNEALDYPSLKEGIDLIHEAGGLAFLAHPAMYKLGQFKTVELMNAAVKAGVDGLEIIHSMHTDYERDFLRQMARMNSLYTSGGTDFHGKTKPDINMLTGKEDNVRVDFSLIEPWFDKVNKFNI